MDRVRVRYRPPSMPGIHLARSFSHGEIFIDVDAIKPGLDFVKQLDAQVSQCDVLLAIIGPHWRMPPTIKDAAGSRATTTMCASRSPRR
jgi:hypothetical protein